MANRQRERERESMRETKDCLMLPASVEAAYSSSQAIWPFLAISSDYLVI